VDRAGGNITILIKSTREVTFQINSTNKKMQFEVNMDEFYKLEKLPLGAEDTLTLQGTRYISFQQGEGEAI